MAALQARVTFPHAWPRTQNVVAICVAGAHGSFVEAEDAHHPGGHAAQGDERRHRDGTAAEAEAARTIREVIGEYCLDIGDPEGNRARAMRTGCGDPDLVEHAVQRRNTPVLVLRHGAEMIHHGVQGVHPLRDGAGRTDLLV